MYLDSNLAAECCGCTACKAVCPKGAIRMKANRKGFLTPIIDDELCINCGLCRNVCDFSLEKPSNHTVQVSFAVRHLDQTVLKTSRSGGAFYALAQAFIDEYEGDVWGAAFDSKLEVIHRKVTKIQDLQFLQGSKYVQSDLGNAFEDVYEDLKKGKAVMFSGTACQIAGLLSYLGKMRCDTSKLLTCDIVCQGVPSPALYRDYRRYLEEKHGAELSEFNFRDSSRIGWEGHEESFKFSNSEKKYFSRQYANYYYYYMRESCFNCKYAGLHRPADLTLADFWGVREKHPEFYDKDGNSLVLINTGKGISFFELIKSLALTKQVKVADCLQPRLMSPSKKPENYEDFWEEYSSLGAEYCIQKYGKESFKSKLVYMIKPLLRKVRIYL